MEDSTESRAYQGRPAFDAWMARLDGRDRPPKQGRPARGRDGRFRPDPALAAYRTELILPGRPRRAGQITVQQFQRQLDHAGLADRTVEVYTCVFRQVLVWAHRHEVAVEEMEATHIAALSRDWADSSSSRKLLRCVLRYLFKAVGRDNPPLEAVRVPPTPQLVVRALDRDDATVLAKTARGWVRSGQREGLAVLFGLYQALRRHEIAKVRYDELDIPGRWQRVLGKGDKLAEIPLHEEIVTALGFFPQEDTPYVFAGRFGGYVSTATVWKWVRQVGQDAGLGPVTPHVLRHTALTWANDELGDLRAVQAFARHSKPSTTSRYTRASENALRRVSNALNY